MTDTANAEMCAQVLNWCDSIVRSGRPCAETARLIDLAREALEAGRHDLCVRLALEAVEPDIEAGLRGKAQ